MRKFIYAIGIILVILLYVEFCHQEINTGKQLKRKSVLSQPRNYTDPLRIGASTLRSYEGATVPYHKWSEWGFPETLRGTNNTYWIAYLPKANVTFKSRKADDMIIWIQFDKP